MSYGAYLRELLRPLRIYGLEGTANGGELEAQGKALDGVEAAMEEVQREMLICTAEGRGLEAVEALLARKPVAASLERRRHAGPCLSGPGAGRPAAHRRGQLYLDGDQR